MDIEGIAKIDGVYTEKYGGLVLVELKDRNGKPKFVVCESMEFAKTLFGSKPKREITLYKDCELNHIKEKKENG